MRTQGLRDRLHQNHLRRLQTSSFFPHMTTCDLWETHFQSYIHICIYIHIHIYRNVITCLSTTVYSVVTCNFCHTLTLLFPMYTSVYSSSQMPEDVYQTLQMVSLNKAALARFKVKKSNFSLLENGLLFKTKFLAIKYPQFPNSLLNHQFHSQRMSNSYKTHFYPSPMQIQYWLLTTVLEYKNIQ